MSVLAVQNGGRYVELPAPAYSSFSSVWQEGNVANRNTQWTMIKKRIATKYVITCEWHKITNAQKNTIISNTDANSFQLRFVSLMDDSVHYGTFYRGNDLAVKTYGKWNGTKAQYYDVTASFMEL